MTWFGRVFFSLLALVFFGPFIYLFGGASLRMAGDVWAAPAFQQTTAEITEKVDVWDNRPRSERTCWMHYRYMVKGQIYTGTRLGILHGYRNGRQSVECRYLERLGAVGDTVPVFYDPDRPDRALLIRDVPWSGLLALQGSTLMYLALVFLICRSPQTRVGT